MPAGRTPAPPSAQQPGGPPAAPPRTPDAPAGRTSTPPTAQSPQPGHPSAAPPAAQGPQPDRSPAAPPRAPDTPVGRASASPTAPDARPGDPSAVPPGAPAGRTPVPPTAQDPQSGRPPAVPPGASAGRTPTASDPRPGQPPAVPPMPGWPVPAGEQGGGPRGPVVAGVAHFTPAAPPSPDYVGYRAPTYAPEPTALPVADPEELGELVSDTVLEGARYGVCTLRAVSLRGDSARYRGEARRDALLVARFGSGEQTLVLVAMATGVRAAPGAHRAAAEACRWIGQAVGRSHERLVEDLRADRRGDLKSGLNRLTDRTLGKLRADSGEPTASLRCLLLPADPDCRTRVFFGAGEGGLFRLRDGEWRDIEPAVPGEGTGAPDGDRLTMDLGIPVPPSPYEAAEPPQMPFRFRAVIARPGDVLMMCTSGLADPLRGEAALRAFLGRRWSRPAAPGLAGFLADTQTRVKGYADDRTAAAVWEA
ncbi:protein phosphatase 2C domain-containing protein [Streptomyces bauhiniae]|uniref:protein phosphatase 2C domain-containing protein n=1 Tax=Streptomyces bauhiniae TaxID=2340725 RepID=UPI003EB6FEAC